MHRYAYSHGAVLFSQVVALGEGADLPELPPDAASQEEDASIGTMRGGRARAPSASGRAEEGARAERCALPAAFYG